ncbi:MAG: porin [Calditrichaeota bacterium]|nr:MAG: porin [Calditrichota bacterium]
MHASGRDDNNFKLRQLCIVMWILVFFTLAAGGLLAQQKPYAINGCIQTTAVKAEDNDGFLFGFDRVRLMFKGNLNPVVNFRLHVDFAKQSTDTDKDGDSPGIIKDAEMKIKANSKVTVLFGKTKTPIGSEFNVAGPKIDFVKRGLGQALVFERNIGAMVKVRKLNKKNLGFDLGIFNPGPNKASDVGSPAAGNDYTIAARVLANPLKNIYAEAYFGNAMTSIAGQENVSIFGAGTRTKFNKLQVKGEYMSRNDGNSPANDGTDFWLSAGYMLTNKIESVVKLEKLDVSADENDQSITVLGLNYFFNPKNRHQSKICVNYQMSDLAGKDAIHLLFQVIY